MKIISIKTILNSENEAPVIFKNNKEYLKKTFEIYNKAIEEGLSNENFDQLCLSFFTYKKIIEDIFAIIETSQKLIICLIDRDHILNHLN